MSLPFQQALLFILIPVVSMVAGGVFAACYPPSPKVQSLLQHFAAGVVFSAVGVEVLPDILHRHRPVAAVVGFAVGAAAMILLRSVSERIRGVPATGETAKSESVLPLVGTVGIDILVDGMLIGIGFAAGQKTGIILTIALGVELLSLGLATAAELGQARLPRHKQIMTVSGLALLPLVGAMAGASLLGHIGDAATEGMLAFGCAALLYLATEELLVEAHEVPETPLSTATFFAGFLVILVLDMVS